MSTYFHPFLTGRYLTISPQIPRASWMSFGINITFFVCTAHRFASCSTRRAVTWNHNFPLYCWVISLTHCTNNSFWIRKPINFFKFADFFQGHMAGHNLLFFFAGNQDVFGSSLFPTCFPLISLYWPLSPISQPSSCLHISDIFLIIDVLCHGPFCCLITTILNFNWTKNIPSGDFIWHYVFMTYWCHVSMLSSSLILSAVSFFEKSWWVKTLHDLLWITPLPPGVGLWPWHSLLHATKKGGGSTGVPLLGGEGLITLLPRSWPSKGLAWTELSVSPLPP